MNVEINQGILSKINFLKENFSFEFLHKISKHLKEKRYGPEELIFSQGNRADSCFILISGEV